MRGSAVNLALGVAALATVGLIVFLVTLLFDSDDDPDGAVAVTLADITEQRGKYLGRRVTVTQRIEDIVTPRTFTIEADPGNTVVVVARRPLEATSAPPVSDGDLVRVSGRVTATDSEEFDRAYETPGEEPERRFDDMPALVDAVVTPTPSRLPSGGDDLTGEELARAPDKYLGELTTVRATVAQRVGPGEWTIGKDFLAVSDLEAADRLQKGERVQLTGVVRRFKPRTLKRDSGISLSRSAKQRDDDYVLVVRGIDFAPREPAR